MHTSPKPLLTIAIAICISLNAFSQTDTSGTDLNLGRIRLKKDFTQSITIKGEQLEKMPFTSLEEALNAWLHGYYSMKGNIVFVVDGNLLNDVNAYSIYDIEEVTLVQNALIQVNGADRQQQLVLITTRKGGTNKQGLIVGGQTSLMRLGKKDDAASGFYHQYQLSAYKNGRNIQYGVSANYLHAVSPVDDNNGTSVHTSPNLDRFRLNAWLTAQLGTAHELYVRLNAVPQVNDRDFTTLRPLPSGETWTYKDKFHSNNWSISPSVGLRSRLFKGLSNELSISYLASRDKTNTEAGAAFIGMQGAVNKQVAVQDIKSNRQQVLISDHINYQASFGDWHLEPSINFMFRYQKYDYVNTTAYTTNNQPTSYNQIRLWNERRTYLLTPSVNLHYKKVFSIQGGAVTNISKMEGRDIKKVFPFATASVNVIPVDKGISTNLQLFASYAQSGNFGDNMRQITDFNNVFGLGNYNFGGPLIMYSINATDSTWWNWQTGLQLGLLNKRITFSYNFEKRDFTAEVIVPTGVNTAAILFPDINSTTHRIGISAIILNKTSLHWLSGITATSIRNKPKEDISFYNQQFTIGDFNSKKASWTGGWVNRLTWRQFSAGADIVYYFIKDQIPLFSGNEKVNALSLQNIYAGYTMKLKSTRTLEVYADCKGIAQHSRYALSGSGKYYGLGFKSTL